MGKRAENLSFFARLGGKSLADDVLTYEKVMSQNDQRYGAVKGSPSTWRIVGAVEHTHSYERGVRLQCEYGWVELFWIAPNCIRIRKGNNANDLTPPFSYAVSKAEWPEVHFEVIEGQDAIEMRTSALVCRVGKQPFRLGLETLQGHLICIDSVGLQTRDNGGARLSMKMHPEEASYGLGERASGLNLRGKQFQLWNVDAVDYQRDTDPLYYSIPFYLGIHTDVAYGVYWDNSNRGLVDVGKSVPGELTFEAEAGELCYYLFAGADVNSVLARYTELTGRIPLPPLWALGYQQSRFSYYPQATVLDLARNFREHGIPCDVIYLDIHYLDSFRVFTWDTARFPDLKQMTAELHRLGFKIIAILDPGVKMDTESSAYRSGFFHDVFLKYPDGETVSAPVWAGMSHFPDFTKPAARTWWAGQCAKLLEAGIDGIWNDMCEPAIFAPDRTVTLPDYVQHDREGQGGDHLGNHNVYGMLMGRSSLEALETHRPGLRPVNIIRAGFAGAQRYAMSWTGDNASDWDHLRLSISMTLNMGLSGAPLTGPDVGGFRGDTTGELMTRWIQAACLLPFFRNHTSFETASQEPWSFGQPYEVINRLMIELRYRLMPYLYSVVAQCREYGWPIVRPIFTVEPYNPEIRSIDDSYLLGDAVLVAPVLQEGAVDRSLYLPAGQWYDFWSNELLDGEEHITVPAPLERLPLFIRAGAALPMWPEMQYAGEKTVETLVMRIYPGEFETIMYEDAGEGLGYQQGDYRWVYVSTAWDDDKLIINRRVAGGYEPSYKAIRLEVVGFDEEPAEVRVDRHGAPLWFYDDDMLELTVEPFRMIEITRKPTTSERTLMRKTW
jgi:alpha-glucosidase